MPSPLCYVGTRVNVSVAQWIGNRAKQEDAYAVRHYPDAALAVVCDGMGGHDCGRMAAELAANSFVEAFDKTQGGTVADRLRAALDQANDAVGELFRNGAMYGGTTLLAAYVGGGVLWWISVGNSPLFIWRHGRLLRPNADHSMRSIYGEFVKSGTMGFAEAMAQGHSLRSAVTGEKIPMIDAPATPYPLLPGDRILLASDGVDELLLPTPLSPALRRMFDDRSNQLAAEVVTACERMELPEADNATVLHLDY